MFLLHARQTWRSSLSAIYTPQVVCEVTDHSLPLHCFHQRQRERYGQDRWHKSSTGCSVQWMILHSMLKQSTNYALRAFWRRSQFVGTGSGPAPYFCEEERPTGVGRGRQGSSNPSASALAQRRYHQRQKVCKLLFQSLILLSSQNLQSIFNLCC